MSKRCPECGVPLDEVPFDACETHRKHEASQPPVSEADADAALDYELLAVLYGRCGDD